MQIYDEPNPLSKPTISALKIKSWLTGETNMPESKDFLNSIIGFRDVLKDRKYRNTGNKSRLSVRFQVENVPNPLSTIDVIQDSSLNPLGKPILNWNIGSIETKTIFFNLAALSSTLQNMGLGILKLDWQLLEEQTILPKDLRGGQHHCGTLRMASDPSHGVVDENLKVFGTSNLYVCSSAVFPTNSWANPTLTILALADRLKDHLLD